MGRARRWLTAAACALALLLCAADVDARAGKKKAHRSIPESMLRGAPAQTEGEGTRIRPSAPGEGVIDPGAPSSNGTSVVPPAAGSTDDCKDSERDCAGVCFGTAVRDKCGTCGGQNEACTDCAGVINGPHVRDRANQCCKRAQIDCHGDCMGMAQEDDGGRCCYANERDSCGVCFGRNRCVDCNGDPRGTAARDDCNVCAGGDTGRAPNADKDCAGVCFGPARTDDCNVCSGGKTGHAANSDKDCRGVCFGPTRTDACGDCGGDGTRCTDCAGIPNGGAAVDMCGQCRGDNSTCCGAYGNCNNRGTCTREDGGSCMCDLGWSGRFCTRRQSMCKWQDCGLHGRCDADTGACVCDAGFIGDHCECSMCSGHGLPDFANGCTCKCLDGYTGPDCSVCAAPAINGWTYVCVSKHGENLNDRRIDEQASRQAGTPVLKPLRFMLVAVPKSEVEDVLINNHPLTRNEEKFALLPGTTINDTVYGCNCAPTLPYRDGTQSPPVAPDARVDTDATPTDADVDADADAAPRARVPRATATAGGTGAKRRKGNSTLAALGTDAIAIRAYMIRNPLSDVEKHGIDSVESHVTRYHRFVHPRALTLMEAEGFLQQIFDFADISIDVATGTPETVGAAVDQLENNITYDRISCIAYFIVTCTLITIGLILAILAVLFITGGSIVNVAGYAGGGGPSEEGYEEIGGDVAY